MFDRTDNIIASDRPVRYQSALQRPTILLAAGSVILSSAAIVGTLQPSNAAMKKRMLSQPSPSPSTETLVPARTPAPPVAESQVIPDGVYLYGQSSKPNRVGSEYMVFESRQDRVVGALYLPQSSFDCFYGRRDSQALSLNIVHSYHNTLHTYAVALTSVESTIASTGNLVGDFGVQGLQRIEEVSQNDTRILEMCKESYQDEVWE